MINLKYNKQTPCHVVGFVANTYFLSGIVSTFIFLWFWILVSIFFWGEASKFLETPDLFLLELACSEIGLVSTHHLLVVKSLIFKAMISSPRREGGQRDSMQQQCFSLRCKPKNILGMNSDQIELSIYI